MSATVNAELFSTYFGGAPMLSIPGRTFGVDVFHLEDVLELTQCNPPLFLSTGVLASGTLGTHIG